MLVEEFNRCINSDVKSSLDEKAVETSGHKPSPSLQSVNAYQNAPKSKTPGQNKAHNPLFQPICNYCKQSGHSVSDCPVLKEKREKQESFNPTGLTSLKLTPQSCN